MYYRKFLIWQKLDDWGCSTSSFYEVIVSNHSMALPYRIILWRYPIGSFYGFILWGHSMVSLYGVNLFGQSVGSFYGCDVWHQSLKFLDCWNVLLQSTAQLCHYLHNFSQESSLWKTNTLTIFTALYCIEGKVSCPLCVFTPFIQMICGWILNRKQRKQ